MCASVRAFVPACRRVNVYIYSRVRAWARASVRERERASARACERASVHVYLALTIPPLR